MKTRAWPVADPMHGQDFSMRKMNRLKEKLGFVQKTKVAGIWEIYNFHEENFFKFKVDFKIKLNLQTEQEIGNPAQDFQNGA